jgi:chromosomal replication initiation ATPase DnaA
MAAIDDLHPIVGRDREREQLLHLFDSAISGRGRLVLVSAPKTA